jgi:predicted nuclease of predicted toxin-antitoxin system
VKFLVDAQLPARLARYLNSSGHDALHTLELPDGNRTTDASVAEIAEGSDRVVVTKDRDFRDSHLLTRSATSGHRDRQHYQ